MHYLPYLTCLLACCGSLFWSAPIHADGVPGLYYTFVFNPEWSLQDNVSLGQDPNVDEVTTSEIELELDLEYSLDDRAYLFFAASLVDDSATVEPSGNRESASGLEIKQIGASLSFGEVVESEVRFGRVEYISASDWWIWWDEELDSVSVDTSYNSLRGFLAYARRQGPELISGDNIEPEDNKVERVLASLSWAFADDQLFILYYLNQGDGSDPYMEGDIEQIDRIDELDADLDWAGFSYLGAFEAGEAGEFFLDLHYSRVKGDETVYEFEDPEGGFAEFDEVEKRMVDGSAYSYLVNWTPANLNNWSFHFGGAYGSGDPDPDKLTDRSYRQTGLQGDENAFGELFLPEISNMEVQVLGVSWRLLKSVEIQLMGFDYQQDYARDEVRESGIDADPDGLDTDLGREIDLILFIEPLAGLELEFVVAEFEAGKAYGNKQGERSRFMSVELGYIF